MARLEIRRGLPSAAWCVVASALALASGCSCEVAPTQADAGPRADSAAVCSADSECDDGSFCSGIERCMPGAAEADGRGCVRLEPPCMASQRCAEDELRCITSCAVAPDADGDGVDAVECGGADCDDADPNRFPGNPEVCDDGAHDEDCDPATLGARDRDEDGHVDAVCCNPQPGGGMRCGDDCADQRRDVHPGLPEVCDGLDQDCDASIDEGVLVLGWADADYDLHGDVATPMEACPGDPAFARIADDCDDTDATRHAGQLEICDGVDNDCDDVVDESPVSVPWYRDDDGDGFGSINDWRVSCAPVAGFSLRARDCDDSDPDVSPAARERCNGIDDDCDGRAGYLISPGDTEDDDGDGSGDRACGGADCDDARLDVAPSAPELSDGRDNDCDGAVDGAATSASWYLDRDGDGFGDESAGAVESDTPVPGRVTRGGDCDDTSVQVRPGVRDACGGVDADCDGVDGDDDTRSLYFQDADADGWGADDLSAAIVACVAPAGHVARTGDCADTAPSVHPLADETCDLMDEDCDEAIDEDSERTWYRDRDGDGFGDMADAVVGCDPPVGYVSAGGDCADARADVAPGAPELCDAADQDCDGAVDEAASATCAVLGGTGVCTAGACVIASCMSGRGDCDGSFATGCEIDTGRSAGHCGMCGMGCGLGDTCGRGALGTCDHAPTVSLAAAGAVGAGYDGVAFFAVRSTGGLLSWGNNVAGKLGRGAGAGPSPLPLSDVAQVSGGAYHACARTRDGLVHCWGANDSGQLGTGVGGSRSGSLPVPGVSGAVDISVGSSVSCALLASGTVRCWGRRRSGLAGAAFDVPGITDAVSISATAEGACAMRPAAGGGREVWCWGADSSYGACGGCAGCCGDTPRLVTGLPTDLVDFGEGWADHMCVITGGGGVLCWGHGLQIGAGIEGCVCPALTPIAPMGLTSGVIALAQSQTHDCALVRRGAATEVWCWGSSDAAAMAGAYGDGPRLHAGTPTRAAPTIDDARAVAVGVAPSAGSTCVLRATGETYCFGGDASGELGDDLCSSARVDPTRPELAVCGLP